MRMPMMTFFLLTAVLGLCLGSFVNVLILRDKERLSILTGRSHCPHCKHELAWYDLVPLFSFLFLAGKCRYCKGTISWQYPLIEFVAALLTVYAAYYGLILHNSLILAIGLGVALLLFLTVSVIDIQSLEIPIDYAIVAAVIGAGGVLLSHTQTPMAVLEGILIGAGSLAFILYGWKLLFKQDGMGVGDIWLGGCIGAIVGSPLVIIMLMAAFMIGALGSILLLGIGKKSMQQAVPFGPYLALGCLVALQWGPSLIHWYIL